MRVPLLVLAILAAAALAGCSDEEGVPSDHDPADCVGHRHATFGVAMPDTDGNLRLLDVAEAKDAAGRPYYQLGIAPNQDVGIHMHLTGAEAGASDVAAAQLHMEKDGCIDIARGLKAVDVEATASRLTVAGEHARAGTWTAAGDDTVHVWIQVGLASSSAPCAWTWGEVGTDVALKHVVADGESFLVVFGDPAPGNVAALQAQVPAPVSRGYAAC